MRKVAVQPLTMEAFRPYGDFVSLLKTGDGAPGFYPDLLQLPLGQAVTTVGLVRIQAGRVADMLEYHQFTSEGLLPLDGPCDIFVGQPVPGNPFAAVLHGFRIPAGTFVRLNPGVVHGTQLPVNDAPVSVLLILPAFTVGNDTQYVFLSGEERLTLQWEENADGI